MAGSPYVTTHIRPAGRTISAPAAQNNDAVDARLSALETDLGTAETDIATLETDLGTAETAIDTLETDVADHETRIVALEGA